MYSVSVSISLFSYKFLSLFFLLSKPVFVATLNYCWHLLARAETHFDRPCWLEHGSGRVCPGSAGSRSRGSNMDSGKPIFMLGAPRPTSLSLRGPSPWTLTFLREARFIVWRLRSPFLGNVDGARGIFGAAERVWATALRTDPPKKPCATLVPSVTRTTNTDIH